MNLHLVHKVIPVLQKMGLNEYESRAYLALLRHNPSTAAEVARMAEIPRTRVYDVLDRLIDLALASRFSESPKRYAPLPYELFLRQKTREFKDDHSFLNDVLGRFSVTAAPDAVFNIYGVDRIFAKARDLIGRCRQRLYLAAFEEEVEHLTAELDASERRGIQIKGCIQIRPGHEDPFFLQESRNSAGILRAKADRVLPFAEEHGRFILLSRDHEELLFGFVYGQAKSRAILTQNPILIYGLEQLVRHDMYVSEVERLFGEEIREALGPAYVSLLAGDAKLAQTPAVTP